MVLGHETCRTCNGSGWVQLSWDCPFRPAPRPGLPGDVDEYNKRRPMLGDGVERVVIEHIVRESRTTAGGFS
jgi:hypothetical protein